MRNIMYVARKKYVSTNEFGFRLVDLASRKETFFTYDDVECLVFDNLNCFFSAKVVNEAVKHNIGLLFCDEKHSPIVLAESVVGQADRLTRINSQLSFSSKMKKRMWRKIVIAKINNQADCTMEMKNDEANSTAIQMIGKNVVDNDIHNNEAQAARKYFKAVFGKEFKRGRYDDLVNSCLNYGYSLLRATIRRQLILHGTEPCFGIHHNSTHNPFNLSDDLIEPFRPFIDMIVIEIMNEINVQTFNWEIKQKLFQVFFEKCIIDEKVYTVSDAIEVTVLSFINCIEQNSVSSLRLPSVIEGGR
ncbi:CRISPR-associated endonuclease Cas1 [Ligilactobacillus pabuli]|uniref:CRISPR-associated endonuclease Cas1 n=1 Tax=Ligilactobacillus pabuli TaxID=2886039 RepID=A0ABQ5JEU5_9LACO|nr:type II CRISPR-associated endonuclease Cas1 [Ligilactobacillus pabuli]GKS80589.1 CRISPR-associated endonuclease Cas1 [Ligilactobacillus pabuli]